MTNIKRNKKVPLTNRQKLWKQVNKKITKVVYTFNPNLYKHSFFYENEHIIRPIDTTTTVTDCYDDDSFKWSNIISNIDWSRVETTRVDDNDEDIEINESVILPPFDFDAFKIGECKEEEDDDIAYEKMWN